MTAAVIRLNLSGYSRLVAHAREFRETVDQHLQILTAALVPAVVLFAGLAPAWTAWVFGEKWRGLAVILLAQAPGYLLASVFWGVLNPALLLSKKHRHLLYWLMGFTAVYAVLTRILSPKWGAAGAAIAFSVTEIALHPLLFRMYGQIYGGIQYWRIFSKMSVAAGSLGLIWYVSGTRPWLGGCLAVAYLMGWSRWNWELLKSARRELDLGRGSWPESLLQPAPSDSL